MELIFQPLLLNKSSKHEKFQSFRLNVDEIPILKQMGNHRTRNSQNYVNINDLKSCSRTKGREKTMIQNMRGSTCTPAAVNKILQPQTCQ